MLPVSILVFFQFAIEEICNSEQTHFESHYMLFNTKSIQLREAIERFLDEMIKTPEELEPMLRLLGIVHDHNLKKWVMYFQGVMVPFGLVPNQRWSDYKEMSPNEMYNSLAMNMFVAYAQEEKTANARQKRKVYGKPKVMGCCEMMKVT